MIQEIRRLLEIAQNILVVEALIISKLNGGGEYFEQLIAMDNRVWAILNRVLEILDEYEEGG